VIEPHEFDLQWEGRRCVVDDLGSKAARSVARRVMNIIGRGLSAANVDSMMELEAAGARALGTMLALLDDETIEFLTATFMPKTRIEREPGSSTWVMLPEVEALVFAGGPGNARWLRWLAFCLEITCRDFFVAAFAAFQKTTALVKAKGEVATPSPSTSPRSGTFTA
jgi:hypothetical protein